MKHILCSLLAVAAVGWAVARAGVEITPGNDGVASRAATGTVIAVTANGNSGSVTVGTGGTIALGSDASKLDTNALDQSLTVTYSNGSTVRFADVRSWVAGWSNGCTAIAGPGTYYYTNGVSATANNMQIIGVGGATLVCDITTNNVSYNYALNIGTTNSVIRGLNLHARFAAVQTGNQYTFICNSPVSNLIENCSFIHENAATNGTLSGPKVLVSLSGTTNGLTVKNSTLAYFQTGTNAANGSFAATHDTTAGAEPRFIGCNFVGRNINTFVIGLASYENCARSVALPGVNNGEAYKDLGELKFATALAALPASARHLLNPADAPYTGDSVWPASFNAAVAVGAGGITNSGLLVRSGDVFGVRTNASGTAYSIAHNTKQVVVANTIRCTTLAGVAVFETGNLQTLNIVGQALSQSRAFTSVKLHEVQSSGQAFGRSAYFDQFQAAYEGPRFYYGNWQSVSRWQDQGTWRIYFSESNSFTAGSTYWLSDGTATNFAFTADAAAAGNSVLVRDMFGPYPATPSTNFLLYSISGGATNAMSGVFSNSTMNMVTGTNGFYLSSQGFNLLIKKPTVVEWEYRSATGANP